MKVIGGNINLSDEEILEGKELKGELQLLVQFQD